jgi:hypothetical protein
MRCNDLRGEAHFGNPVQVGGHRKPSTPKMARHPIVKEIDEFGIHESAVIRNSQDDDPLALERSPELLRKLGSMHLLDSENDACALDQFGGRGHRSRVIVATWKKSARRRDCTVRF